MGGQDWEYLELIGEWSILKNFRLLRGFDFAFKRLLLCQFEV